MRLTLVLGEPETTALVRLAAREDRPPRSQAARLLRASLVRTGDLATDARLCDRSVHAPASSNRT